MQFLPSQLVAAVPPPRWCPPLIQAGDSPDKATAQLNANASKLEQSSTRPAAITARNPPDTKSWLRMIHLLYARPNSRKTSEQALFEGDDACRACDSLRR